MHVARSTIAAAACLLAAGSAAAARPTDAEISALAQKYSGASIAQRQDMHRNPELSNRETRTGELVAKHLQSLGYEVQAGIAHTGVVGILKGGKPGRTIAVRADMDALPVTEQADYPFKSTVRSTYLDKDVGVMHACGHDVHTAALLGVASMLAEIRDDLPGTVMLIFQPAEEGVPAGERGGARMMVEDGVFARVKPDAVIAFHTNGSPPDAEGDDEGLGIVAYASGPAFAAATRWEATVKGRQAHGSTPHLGVDPIVTASGIVMALQTIRSRILSPLSENVITVGIFRSGERHNIIPESAQLGGTIRTFDDATLETIQARMREIFEGHTKAAHATYELSFVTGHPMTVNDAALTEQLVPSLERVLGKDKVRLTPPITGSEDFSYFAQAVPGFYFRLGVVPEGKESGGHHTPTFYAADESVPIAMRLMTTLVVDYLAGAP
ncbi:MAG TPA: amidohydrolase [Steroidobacteraceae bacterium]|nr:amidohydrolase [Steroidobacteraceae bacterium]